MYAGGGISCVLLGRRKGDGEVNVKLMSEAPDSAQQTEKSGVAGGGAASQNRVVSSSRVRDDTKMAELTEAGLADAVEQAIQLGLILTAHPNGRENRGKNARVLIRANAKERGIGSGINIDWRKGEGIWGCRDDRREMNKDETLQERGPEVGGEKARQCRTLRQAVKRGKKDSNLGGWTRKPLAETKYSKEAPARKRAQKQ